MRWYGPAVAAFVGVVIAILAPPAVLWLDVGSPGDGAYVQGFNEPELNEWESFRWSEEQASISLPVGRPGQYEVDLALAVVEPGSRNLDIVCGETSQTIPLGDRPGNSNLRLVCRTAVDTLTVDLAVPGVEAADEERSLGVSVRDVRVTAAGGSGEILSRFRLAAVVVLSLLAVWIGAASVGFIPLVAVSVAGILWMAVLAGRPDWLLTMTSGPGSLLALIGAAVAWTLHKGMATRARYLAVLAPLTVLVVTQASPVLILPSRWTDGDVSALRFLPWLAGGSIVVAALRGRRADLWLARAGSVVGLLLLGLPVLAKLVVDRWRMTLAVPDWSDQASVIGAIYLAVVVVIVAVGLFTVRHGSIWATFPVVILGLGALLVWRIAVMDLNGDEPHYYVTARSLGADFDVELLNNYHEESYRENTISPDGNVAVVRDASADRYTPIYPSSGGETDTVRLNGSVEVLPPLQASQTVAILSSGTCAIDEVTVSAPAGGSRNILLRLRDAAGQLVWERNESITGTETVAIAGMCPGQPVSLNVTSEAGPISAYAVDQRAGLLVLPGQIARQASTFGGLPRDRYASRNAVSEVTVHNPGLAAVEARVVMRGGAAEMVSEIPLQIPAGGTVTLSLRSAGFEMLRVESSGRLTSTAVGRMWAGAYSLPEPLLVADWQLEIAADNVHDSGVWLTLMNRGSGNATVSLDDSDESQLVELCAHCSETVLLAARDRERLIRVRSDSGDVFASAIRYREQTGALHFDPGLPLLAAPLARVGDPRAALLVPFVAALALFPGLVLLLRRVGVEERLAALTTAAVVLLAPLSTYSVRLYTEIFAACLVVWALVSWDASRERARFLLPVVMVALVLPVLHGRYAALSAGLGLLVVVAVLGLLRTRNRLTLGVVAGAIVVVAGLALVAFQLSVGLQERLELSYFATNWASISLLGVLFDRGSGLVPVAPWVLLALWVPRPLQPIQRAALGLILIQLAVVVARAGGWQTWGAPARYILPVVPLVALFVAPAIGRLWSGRKMRPDMAILAGWSIAMTVMLHWLPLSGYVLEGRYLIDEAWQGLIGFSPVRLFPMIAPEPGSFMVGTIITLALLIVAGWLLLTTHLRDSKRKETPQRGVSTGDANVVVLRD